MIEVIPVATKADLRAFVKFPWEIYRHDPHWVAPLVIERMDFLNPRKNPFFQHSEAELFLARKGSAVVGRISAIKYSRHLETYHDNTGFFGFFESVYDRSVANALFDKCCEWLSKRNLSRVRGPMNFSINDECGLLVEGFDVPPIIMHTHNPPYYQTLIETYGFKKIQDLYAYRLDTPKEIPEKLARMMKIILNRHDITVRPLNMKKFDSEIDRIHEIHNAAWSENWGAVPLTRDEVHKIAKDLKLIVDPDLVLIAEAGDKTIGVSVTLPDINQALKHAHGRLLPFGLFKILWYKRKIDAVRVLIMGVLKEYRHRGIDGAMYYKSMEAAIRKGYRWGDMSWILESNFPMRRILEHYGARIYKTYRIYEKNIL